MDHGFFAFHANQLEDLREIVVKICKTAPLPPLCNDMFLVQSNGIAQWLKLALAQDESKGGLGIATSLEFSLPSSFIWQAYRAVLSKEQVPESSPLDKNALSWRLYRLLPTLQTLENASDFQTLNTFLAGERPEIRHFQLAQRLADLYDQYQVYRADWLALWEAGQDKIITAKGEITLSQEQQWQAKLWRLILQDVGESMANTSRSSIHHLFYKQDFSKLAPANPELLPKRIFVFGVSSLPKQILEALHVVSQFTQVVFCVVNPCRFYWADIVSDRELLLAQQKRGKRKASLSGINIEDIHQHANPLLASLGKQGRDYIRMLDEFDNTDINASKALFNSTQVDVFNAYEKPANECSLLSSIQNDIFDLKSTQEILSEERVFTKHERYSISFHEVYSEQREVEVLHDQLLHAFEQDPQLQASDIIVMMPDVNTYSSHIRGVFGFHDTDDARRIPYTISDQGIRQQSPVLIALEQLLSLTQSRFTYSDILGLLDLPAIRDKFGIAEHDLDTLKTWIKGVNIRWGLSPENRKHMLDGCVVSGNTWLEGIKSMFLGYAMSEQQQWSNTQAFSEIGGLQASLLGPLLDFIDALEDLYTELWAEKTIAQWQSLVSGVIQRFFSDKQTETKTIIQAVLSQIDKLYSDVELADSLQNSLPLISFKESLMAGLDKSTVNHKFMIGKVNFATLMPMRAIPFKRVYLLGMTNGDYPRSKVKADFDLMARDYRPGDRSMRDDDRYLFLEAMLSARESLYISWVGRGIKDDSERPPSVLVAQLRDYIDKCWQLDESNSEHTSVSSLITTLHPLQAYSKDHFMDEQAHLFTFANEWQSALADNTERLDQKEALPFLDMKKAFNVKELSAFLKEPIKFFYNQRLLVFFESIEVSDYDNESFVLDRLTESILLRELIASSILATDAIEQVIEASDVDKKLDQDIQRLVKSGVLGIENTPLSTVENLKASLLFLYERYSEVLSTYPIKHDAPLSIDFSHTDNKGRTIHIRDNISGFRKNEDGKLAKIHVATSRTSANKAKSDFEPRYENLIPYYIEHLLGHASGARFTTFVIGHEHARVFKFDEIDDCSHIHAIVDTLIKGLCEPLALDARASFAFVNNLHNGKKDPLDEAIKAYEQSLAYDKGYLRGAFPKNDLVVNEMFTDLSCAIYEKIYVSVLQALESGDAP